MRSGKFQFFGMLLVLISSFVQFFILIPSQNTTNGAVIYKLETKIDHVFHAARSNYLALHPDHNQSNVVLGSNVFDSYMFAEQNDYLESTEQQTHFFGKLVALLFMAGTGLLLAGKWIEIGEGKGMCEGAV